MANSTVFSGVKITYFGHSSLCLEADGAIFYLDPFVLPVGAKPASAIFYTHGHFDHCVIAPKITTSSTVLIGSQNCKIPLRVMANGASEKIGPITTDAVPAYNANKRFHPIGEGNGYVFHFRSARVYVAGDTDFIPEMEKIKCDIAIVPIGGTYTMNAAEAAEAIAAMMPKVAIPYHYNYLEDQKADPQAFKAQVGEKTGGKVDVRILSP